MEARPAETELEFAPAATVLTEPGASTADKARIFRFGDGTLLVAWQQAAGPAEHAWSLDGLAHAPRDIFVRVSVDDGISWSAAINVSDTAQLTDPNVLYDRVGDGSGLANYYGDSGKANVFVTGDRVLVAWNDTYCGEGRHGPARYETEAGFVELPYRCLYAARLAVSAGVVDIIAVDRLTDATRDVTNEVARGTGAGFAMAWQEDPAGLQLGEARGEGDGASGARVTSGTDIWYSWISAKKFADPSAAWSQSTPVSDNYDYDGMVVTGGGSSRPMLALAGSPPTAIVVYEESKGRGSTDVGKFVRFHEFPFNAPPSSEAGVIISAPDENARRARVMAMTSPGPASGTRMLLMWRQGDGIQGAPADFMMRTGVVAAGTDLGAVPNAGFRVEDLWPAVDTDDPSASDAPLNISGATLSDPSSVDPLANAKAHRAVMNRDFIYAGYTQDDDASDGINRYRYLLRRSADGGRTWSVPFPVSDGVPGSENVIEPRLVRTPGTVASGDPGDIHNPDVYVIAWGTETTPPDGAEPYRDALFVTRTVDRGLSFERVQAMADTRTAADQTDEQIQLRVSPDGQAVAAVWIRRDTTGSNVVFNTAVGITPTADLSISASASNDFPDIGETIEVDLQVFNGGPQDATELVLDVVASAGLAPTAVDTPGGDCQLEPVIQCILDNLAPDTGVTVRVSLLAMTKGTQSVAATVAAREEEPTPLDNEVSLTIEVVPHADVAVSARIEEDHVESGLSFVVDFSVINNGPQPATGARLVATVSGNADFTLAEGCDIGSDGVSCGLPNLQPGEGWQGRAVVHAIRAGTAAVRISVAANEIDPVPANNAAQASISIFGDGGGDGGGGCVYDPAADGDTTLPLLVIFLLGRLLWRLRQDRTGPRRAVMSA